MIPPTPQFGQRCERAGVWRSTEDGDWVFGEVIAFGRDALTIRTNLGRDMTVSQQRATWKTAFGGWAIWAPWVMGLVLHIEQDERRADAMGAGRLRLRPLVGDYVVVHRGDGQAPGFIVEMNGDTIAVSHRLDGPRHLHRASVGSLFWDDQIEHWRIRIGTPQEDRRARPTR